jgi:hypothetical protein
MRLWEQFSFNGIQYVTPGGNIHELTALQGGSNPIVAGRIRVRAMLIDEVRFL